MIKRAFIFISIIPIIVITYCILGGCSNNTDFKIETGYESYISDNNSSFSFASYFGSSNAMVDNEEARKYYSNNVRQCGDYLVTDYEDGICINRYCGNESEIYIPETLDGKPVIKLGGYLEKTDNGKYEVVSAFSNIKDCVLYLPSKLKYINCETLLEYKGYLHSNEAIQDSPHIKKIYIDEKNPYYFSDEGTLMTKDKNSVLFLNELVSEYAVLDEVENFVPINEIPFSGGTLIFNKNIKKISAYICDEEGIDISEEYDENYYSTVVILPNTVKGYKGTVAEEWAEKYYQNFISLGENTGTVSVKTER